MAIMQMKNKLVCGVVRGLALWRPRWTTTSKALLACWTKVPFAHCQQHHDTRLPDDVVVGAAMQLQLQPTIEEVCRTVLDNVEAALREVGLAFEGHLIKELRWYD